MTLRITSNKIYIENPGGETKFDSDNRLLYKVGYKSGSMTFNSSTTYLSHSLGFTIDETYVTIININITSCSGAIGSTMLNNKIPVSGAIPIHWEGFVDNNIPTSVQENLEIVLTSNTVMAQFLRYDARVGTSPTNGTKTTSFTYEVHAYKHYDIN